jgi:glycosyltransferase involved in cell wall biosynthesis
MPLPILIATVMRAQGDTGVQSHFRDFAAFLIENGHQSHLATPFDAPKWQVYPLFAARKLIEPLNGTAGLWWFRFWNARFLLQILRHALSDGQPCIVYAQCPVSAAAALEARVTTNQRVAMIVHFNISEADEWAGKGTIPAKGSLFNKIRRFEECVLPHLDGLIFSSAFMRQELNKRVSRVSNVPSQIIPNFVHATNYRECNPVDTGELICVGTLEPRKNQRYALKVIAAAKQIGRPIHLTLIGDGPDRRVLEAMAAQLHVDNYVRFAGYVEGAARLFAGYRACLHVALIDNFPHVLIEAMAQGRPVFASAVGGIPEAFDDGVEGRLVPLDDANAAARMIIEWLDNKEIMARAQIAAHRRFLDHFQGKVVAARLRDFLMSCGDTKDRRRDDLEAIGSVGARGREGEAAG